MILVYNKDRHKLNQTSTEIFATTHTHAHTHTHTHTHIHTHTHTMQTISTESDTYTT